MPITVVCEIEGISPLSYSRYYEVESLPQESGHAYEERTWRERFHCDDKGIAFIPPMAMKNALSEFARYRGIKVPGTRGKTYAAFFDSSVLCLDPITLGVHKDDIKGEWLFVPSDGRKGGSKRVHKCFPYIPPGWRGTVKFTVLDRTITEPVFLQHFDGAGTFIGVGRFRPQKGGFYGRFNIKSFLWQDDEKENADAAALAKSRR